MKCTICNHDPCSCGSAKIDTEGDVIDFLRRCVPAGVISDGEPPPADLLLKIFTDPRSPLKLSDEVLVSFTRRLYELASDAPSSPPNLEQVWDALAMDLSVASRRVGEALVFLVEETKNLIEDHPSIKDHRAYIIDQTIRILAGDRYVALRAAAFGANYNAGVEPPVAEETAEPS